MKRNEKIREIKIINKLQHDIIYTQCKNENRFAIQRGQKKPKTNRRESKFMPKTNQFHVKHSKQEISEHLIDKMHPIIIFS